MALRPGNLRLISHGLFGCGSTILAICFVAFFAPDQNRGQVPSGLQETVQRLVRQLDSNEIGLRAEAERKLIELGPQALVQLDEIDFATSAESAERLRRVRAALHRAAAKQLLQASQVELTGRRTAEIWTQEIERQTGNRLQVLSDPDQNWALNVQLTPFWSGVEQFTAVARLTIDDKRSDRNLLFLVSDDRTSTPAHQRYDGPFQIQLDLDGTGPGDDRLSKGRAQLQLRWEPRLSPIEFSLPIAAFQVLGTDDQPIATLDPATTFRIPVQGADSKVVVSIPLSADAKSVKKIAGKMEVLVAAGAVYLELPNPLTVHDSDLPIGLCQTTTVEAAINDLSLANQRLLLDIAVSYRPLSGAVDLDSHLAGLLDFPITFTDNTDKLIRPKRSQVAATDRAELLLRYEFQLPDASADLTGALTIPEILDRMPVEFEFSPIRLR